ncbi:hypothetical protein LTR28_010689 [Elasticomyces elasticus]|nr:hypothetical protein LTR28_010689 [Elasticomyces elasticus]
MFKPTAPLFRRIRRLALTTKQAGKDYYKGTGTGAMGSHTKYGGYLIDWKKVRTYVVPDLEGFMIYSGHHVMDIARTIHDKMVEIETNMIASQLTPFVAKRIEETKGALGRKTGLHDGRAYLQRWKEAGGPV